MIGKGLKLISYFKLIKIFYKFSLLTLSNATSLLIIRCPLLRSCVGSITYPPLSLSKKEILLNDEDSE